MSPRALFAFASVTVLAAACAQATPDFGDEPSDDDSTSGDTTAAVTTGSGSSGTGTSGNTTNGTGSTGTQMTTGTTTGAGGSGGTATTGSTGGAGGTPTTSTSMTTSGMTNNCLHDTCTLGDALTVGCGDPCVDTVCFDDDFCCDSAGGEWDDLCVEAAVDLCGAMCSTGIVPGDLVISEIMNNPSGSDTSGEWFEVHNATGAAIDLDGFVIRHQGFSVDPNATVTINASVVVSAGGYAVLGLNANTATNGGVNVDYVYTTVNLSNTTDYLAIEDSNGNTIDEVTWSESSGLDPDGKSRSLDPQHLNDFDNDDDTYFCEASSMMGGGDAGTPGQANDTCP